MMQKIERVSQNIKTFEGYFSQELSVTLLEKSLTCVFWHNSKQILSQNRLDNLFWQEVYLPDKAESRKPTSTY